MPQQSGQDELLIKVKNLRKYYPIQSGFFKRTTGHVKAVDGISLHIEVGETLGLVGESGCGKTTTGRCILRAIEATDGEIWFNDNQDGWLDVRTLAKEPLRELRQNMQMIFQNPYSSLDPRMTLLQIVGEPLMINKIAKGKDLQDRVAHLLEVVGLRSEYMSRYPHAFSGGQRQRIGVARALALNPRFIMCDEPVSALDVSIQAQTLNLLKELQEQLDLTYLFVAHDLSVIRHISDRVAVMYVGKLVEMAETDDLYKRPLHPYTEALIASVPKPDPRREKQRIVLPGEVANPANPPSGCYFHPRCQYVQDICRTQEPTLTEIRDGHWTSCHVAQDLNLSGVALTAF